jgi:hypothetical protein
MVGCYNGIYYVGELAVLPSTMELEVCFNDSCATTTHASSDPTCAQWNNGSVVASLCVGGTTDAGTTSLGGHVILSAEVTPHDGDHYVITVKDSSTGTVLQVADGHVDYADVYPNGPDCDSTPCKSGHLTLVSP